ncbi:hypothetical protein JCM6882_008696 [Rhodosporidiobolus microsporus]
MPHSVKIDDSLTLPLPGFGGMGMSQGYGKGDDEESKKVLRKAIEIGCTLWNTATIYGPNQHNEKLLGSVLKEGDNLDKVTVTTKWGLKHVDGGMETDGSAAFARHCLENSIKNLGRVDIWLLHRVDKNTPIEESVQAMEDARKEGKVKYIGLSAMSAATLRRAAKVAKIDFVEMEFSPFETKYEDNGVIEACKDLGVRLFAYSPLGKGLLTGRFRKFEDVQKDGDSRSAGVFPRFNKDVWEHNFKLVEALEKLAEKKGCTPGQLALAWGMQSHGPGFIIPIPGTKNIKYLEENFASRDITLTEDEMASVRKVIEENPIKGEQYAPIYAKMLDE